MAPFQPPEASSHGNIVGRLVGSRYRVMQLVGSGSFGNVFLGRDERGAQKVAIKQFLNRNPDERVVFWRELSLQLRLRHPAIVQVLNFVNEGDEAFLISEFVEGGNLRQLIETNGAMPIEQTAAVLLPVAKALQAAHSQGIIHRDIKPENILIQPDPSLPLGFIPKLTDFGLARFLARDAVANTHHGSPAYMAPEQFYNEYTHQTDIYALGVILYEMLLGNRPFEGGVKTLMKAHIYQPPPGMEQLPAELRASLDRFLAKNPLERLTTMKEAVAELERLKNGNAPATTATLRPTPAPIPAVAENPPGAPPQNSDPFGEFLSTVQKAEDARDFRDASPPRPISSDSPLIVPPRGLAFSGEDQPPRPLDPPPTASDLDVLRPAVAPPQPPTARSARNASQQYQAPPHMLGDLERFFDHVAPVGSLPFEVREEDKRLRMKMMERAAELMKQQRENRSPGE